MKNFDLARPVHPPRCGHDRPLILSHRYKARCPVCGSFWDIDAISAKTAYDGTYPEQRSHYDTAIGSIKVKTLASWLQKNELRMGKITVCEIGFGGGFCLAYLRNAAKKVYGIEAIQKNIDHARSLGVEEAVLYHADRLPNLLDHKIDLWLFQDSFEHIPRPGSFLQWMRLNSSAGARILLVAPEAGSLSEKIMGRWWPHKLRDHHFHWSRRGLTGFFAENGFDVERKFSPRKLLSPVMIALHLSLKIRGLQKVAQLVKRFVPGGYGIFFNIGEQGFIFRRREP